MRADNAGLFWDDTPPPKILKTKPKRVPPPRTWEAPGYLPPGGIYEEALAFDVPQFTLESLLDAHNEGHQLIFDIEVYKNYFLASFMSARTGEVLCIETTTALDTEQRAKLAWVLDSFTTVGFNSIDFDLPITALALAGRTCAQLKAATNQLIYENLRPHDLLKYQRVKALQVDHIDLIEVAPLRANLKIYGGRLHSKRMQDLPFHPEVELTPEQRIVTRWYNVRADLPSTALMLRELREQLKLRVAMSADYAVDLRSKSDAQIAEAVIAAQIAKINGKRPQRPEITPGTTFRYYPPHFLQFQTENLRWVLNRVSNSDFVIADNGTVGMPEHLNELKIPIAHGVYRMGIGGLHSSEQRICARASDEWRIKDRDVVSYYPAIILNCGLYPGHMGRTFLDVYRGLVQRRLAAKAAGDKAVTESLKITINGSFGKLGSPYSILYSPNLLIQVTVTGQLSLLMLIERLELAGISVMSANTDGVVFMVHKDQEAAYAAIVAQWEKDTGFETEETTYAAYYGRDVNNYIAVKKDGKTKNKGRFANPWADPNDSKAAVMRFHKNPQNQICVEAVEAFLVHGRPLLETITACKDVTKFVSVRTVKGGAVKDGLYLGKSIRWYYAQGETGEIIYASTGNKVPQSDGAKPLMDLPDELPVDTDFARYEAEARDMLVDLGVLQPEGKGDEEKETADE